MPAHTPRWGRDAARALEVVRSSLGLAMAVGDYVERIGNCGDELLPGGSRPSGSLVGHRENESEQSPDISRQSAEITK
jgi:hypothetical protein